MSALHDRPTAAELVAAVVEWLEGPVLTEGRPAGSYDVRVALTALQTVQRELARPPAVDRFAGLGLGGHDEIAAAVRAGAVPEALLPAVRAAVLADVEDALRVSNPRALDEPWPPRWVTGTPSPDIPGTAPPTSV